MDSRLVARLLGKLLSAFSLVMLVPVLVACLVDQKHIWIFFGSLLISQVMSVGLGVHGQSATRQRLRVREAIAIVGCGWVLVCLLGALPYIFLIPTTHWQEYLKVFPDLRQLA